MKRHLTLSTMSQHALNHGDTAEAVTDRTPASDSQTRLSETADARPQLTLASELVWRHKLILTGKLDHLSAPELEEEIECLCEEGVTTLTLDLRQLDTIDSTGVTSIARRGTVCKMRGPRFTSHPPCVGRGWRYGLADARSKRKCRSSFSKSFHGRLGRAPVDNDDQGLVRWMDMRRRRLELG
jgi:ABC-type transporter Mla MlaB component